MSLYRLDGGNASCLVWAAKDQAARLIYFGKKLPTNVDLSAFPALAERAVPQNTLDQEVPLTLIPERALGFTGHPGLIGHRAGQDWLAAFVVAEVSQIENKISILQNSAHACLDLDLAISIDPLSGVLFVGAALTNKGDVGFELQWLAPALPLPVRAEKLVGFEGRWTREFRLSPRDFAPGIHLRESRRGRTSHDSFPGLIAGTSGLNWEEGEAWAFHLAWSGEHRVLAERLWDGTRQVQMGMLLHPGEVMIAPGQSLCVPGMYASYSDHGLNGIAQANQSYVRQQLAAQNLGPLRPRPILINTWEAVYFSHDQKKLFALAESAAALGIERFVLDDGWFKGRDSDEKALGDWYVDARKFPEGLTPLIDKVKSLGMEFGLWVEPEMVNPKSELAAAHPDWLLSHQGLKEPSGRNQHVLNLAHPDCFAYLFDRLDELLSNNDIAYLKWDHNRDLTQPGGLDGKASVKAQTENLYRLIDQLRAKHPKVEIESCASGGGRADWGILQRTLRIWTSDSNDPHERQRIQEGFSLFFPPEVMGAHIGPGHVHTSGRHVSLSFRVATALFGHLGVESDLTEWPEKERKALARAITLHKRLRPLLHGGTPWRLETNDPGLIVHGVVAPDRSQAVYAVVCTDSTREGVTPTVRCPGLDDAALYQVKLIGMPERLPYLNKKVPMALLGGMLKVPGAVLAQFGVNLPIIEPDGAILIELIRL